MVDVSGKEATLRIARAAGEVIMAKETLAKILDLSLTKGNVLETARLAGIMAAKKTAELIPLCHQLPLDEVAVEFFPDGKKGLLGIEARAVVTGRTGVEMEALTAVAAAALTVYDMAKAVDRGMVISRIRLLEKEGGRSGRYVRKEP
jgi:cyclic pyranopterin phosphate synthase